MDKQLGRLHFAATGAAEPWKNHAMKLPVHSWCADVNARGALNSALMESAGCFSLSPFCDFMWSSTLWIHCCDSRNFHFAIKPLIADGGISRSEETSQTNLL